MTDVRYVPKGVQYTHLFSGSPLTKAEAKADIIKHSKPEPFLSRLSPPPTKRCEVCKGRGYSSQTGPNAGSCEGCSGLKYIELTDDEIRTEYRDLRKKVCSYHKIKGRMFDESCRLLIEDIEDDTPNHWLQAAKEIERKTRR